MSSMNKSGQRGGMNGLIAKLVEELDDLETEAEATRQQLNLILKALRYCFRSKTTLYLWIGKWFR